MVNLDVELNFIFIMCLAGYSLWLLTIIIILKINETNKQFVHDKHDIFATNLSKYPNILLPLWFNYALAPFLKSRTLPQPGDINISFYVNKKHCAISISHINKQ